MRLSLFRKGDDRVMTYVGQVRRDARPASGALSTRRNVSFNSRVREAPRSHPQARDLYQRLNDCTTGPCFSRPLAVSRPHEYSKTAWVGPAALSSRSARRPPAAAETRNSEKARRP